MQDDLAATPEEGKGGVITIVQTSHRYAHTLMDSSSMLVWSAHLETSGGEGAGVSSIGAAFFCACRK